MYDLLAKDISEAKSKRKLLRSPRMAKEYDKEDIRIIQDVKLAQSIAKEAISKHSDEGLNINIVNVQVSNIDNLTKRKEEISEADISHEELRRSIEMVARCLPSPKVRNLVKILYEIAYENFDTTAGMARWLGVRRESLYYWFKKMGMPSPDIARKMEVNKDEGKRG